MVNIQDFLGKIEDNLTNADPLSYTTNGSRGDLVNWVSVSYLRLRFIVTTEKYVTIIQVKSRLLT